MQVTISVSMPPELVDELDAERRKDESRSEYVRRLIQTDAALGGDRE